MIDRDARVMQQMIKEVQEKVMWLGRLCKAILNETQFFIAKKLERKDVLITYKLSLFLL